VFDVSITHIMMRAGISTSILTPTMSYSPPVIIKSIIYLSGILALLADGGMWPSYCALMMAG